MSLRAYVAGQLGMKPLVLVTMRSLVSFQAVFAIDWWGQNLQGGHGSKWWEL